MIAGIVSTNIRLTILALNGAGGRLSRFFVSQFAVDLGVSGLLALTHKVWRELRASSGLDAHPQSLYSAPR